MIVDIDQLATLNRYGRYGMVTSEHARPPL